MIASTVERAAVAAAPAHTVPLSVLVQVMSVLTLMLQQRYDDQPSYATEKSLAHAHGALEYHLEILLAAQSVGVSS